MSKVFSGIRSSGRLHLGNYLGAIRNWVQLQDEASQCIFSVVDLHGITTPYDPKTYQQQVMDTVLDFLAAGVDPTKALLIRQSHVPQHTELMWLFSTITPVSWLDRLPNYREKLKQVKDMRSEVYMEVRNPGEPQFTPEDREAFKKKISSLDERKSSYENNLSLLAYPVLMAADILLYKSDLVPVGEDQLAHLDLANEVGAKFNYLFGDTFPNIERHVTEGARIMSLSDPTKKMSKTGDDGIALSDLPDEIRAKVKRAATDSGREVKFDEVEKPGISNLLTIYSTLGDMSIGELEKDYEGKSYAEFKADVAEAIVGFLEPFQKRRAELAADMDHVRKILTDSEEKARIIAAENMADIHRKMGLR